MGFKVNKGRFGRVTSVSMGNKALRVRVGTRGGAVRIAGHELRSGTGQRYSSPPRGVGRNTAAQSAGIWIPDLGSYDISVDLGPVGILNMVVDASELTFSRIEAIANGATAKNAGKVANAFRAFVMEWDLRGDDGRTISITPGGFKKLDLNLILGVAVEIANALRMTTEPLGHVITLPETGKSPRVIARNRKTGKVTTHEGVQKQSISLQREQPHPVSRQVAADKTKSRQQAYIWWTVLGLVGGHRYYLNKTGTGLLMTLTVGGCGVWWLVDGIRLARMVDNVNSRGSERSLND